MPAFKVLFGPRICAGIVSVRVGGRKLVVRLAARGGLSLSLLEGAIAGQKLSFIVFAGLKLASSQEQHFPPSSSARE